MTFSPRAIEAAKAIDFAKEARDLKQALADNAYPAADGSADIDNHAIPIIEATLRNVAERLLTAALAVDGMALVPKEPTLEQHIAAMEFALAHMEAHGVTSLSPFEDYPPLRETTAGMYRAMLAAASDEPAPALQGWQPIESAPKDGTAFLAWEREWRGPFKCWWHVKNRNEAYWMDFDDSDPQPTHWQPLPPPPAASDREERR